MTCFIALMMIMMMIGIGSMSALSAGAMLGVMVGGSAAAGAPARTALRP